MVNLEELIAFFLQAFANGHLDEVVLLAQQVVLAGVVESSL